MNQYRLKKPKIRGVHATMAWARYRVQLIRLQLSNGSQAVHRERRKNPPFMTNTLIALTVRELRDKL